MAAHAIGCLLEVLSLAVEEYNSSNMQTTISEAVKAALHDHNGDMHGLCEAIIKIIIQYLHVFCSEMFPANKLLMKPEGQ
ncbi:hypothetical protein F5J12DRAFT_841247 [Pisolithus orientalis]|uniref:uncharacterized protein n=1 Tax=Pisolithus orientalis TaxID=936130 RepID=UPI0022250709|nr:uncharacterized protein F5J12DRAFT_841247 [Pisolithus orientalis]KAI6002472.1 hypothetical protein F5J12DRAFT_841247 [Pisolithus orientalis]